MLELVISPPACAYQLIAAIILSHSPNFHKEKWVHYFFEAVVALTVLLLLLFSGWGADANAPGSAGTVLREGKWEKMSGLVIWNKISHCSFH